VLLGFHQYWVVLLLGVMLNTDCSQTSVGASHRLIIWMPVQQLPADKGSESVQAVEWLSP